jgi:NAD(P)H-quinone oxidoreductase subunit 5
MALAATALTAAILTPPILAWQRGITAGHDDRRLGNLSIGLLFGSAVLALIGALALPPTRVELADPSLVFGLAPGAISFGFLLDRIGLVMVALIGVVGAATTAFAARSLAGDPGRPAFLRWFAGTIAAAQVLVLSANLAQVALAWLVLSLGLHRLLLHHDTRIRAVMAARTKFIISRLGDLGLLLAIAILLPAAGTLDLQGLATAAGDPALAHVMPLAAAGLVLAAVCKSAIFPVHVWLPETLEAPTAVSALMHAGIVNAGGYLLIRTSPLLAQAPLVLDILLVLGTVTAALGMLAMWSQTEVKKALAWSTVGQMGFMMVECGLGAFAAALVHLIGHAGYKAHAFLRSGSPTVAVAPLPPAVGSLGAAAGRFVLAAGLATALSGVLAMTGHHLAGGPILLLALGLGLAQVWLAPVGSLAVRTTLILTLSLILGPCLGAVHAWLQVPPVADPLARGACGWVAGGITAVVLIALAGFSALLPWLADACVGLKIHARHGFYLGYVVERLVNGVWPVASDAHAAAVSNPPGAVPAVTPT